MKTNSHFPVLNFKPATPCLPLEIKALCHLQKQVDEQQAQPHSHNYFEIIWIARGSGTHWINLDKHAVLPNQLFCIQPGQMHHLLADEGAEGIIISFTEAFLHADESETELTARTSLVQLFSAACGMVVQPHHLADVEDILHRMRKEFEDCQPFKAEILKRYLRILLILLNRQLEYHVERTAQTRNVELVQCFHKLLNQQFREQKMVAAYAGQLFVTPNYLNEIIKKNTGYPASYHIQRRVVLEAKRMVVQSGRSMKQIAYELGFNDTCHFSKFFKMVTGKNFSDFKKSRWASPDFQV